MTTHHLILHYDPPRKNSDGRITIERVGGTRQSRPANAEGVRWAREQVEYARRRGFSVDDLALAKVRLAKEKHV